MTAPARTTTIGLGLLLVLAAAAASGLSNFVNIYAVAGTTSSVFVTARNLMVAGLLLPLAYVFRPPRALWSRLDRVDWARLVAIGILGGGVPFLLFFYGLQLATAAHGATTASFLYRTLFLFASVLAFFYLKERFHWRIVAGAVLLLAGSYLLLALNSPVWTDGTVYVLAATVLWAVEYTLSKRAMVKLPATTVALGRMGIGAIFLVGYLAATTPWGAVARLSGGQWDWVVISGVLLTVFVGLWYTGLSRVDLHVGSSVLVLGYPITWVLSVLVSGTSWAVGQVEGALAVAVGVVAVIGLAQLTELKDWLRAGLPIRSSSPVP